MDALQRNQDVLLVVQPEGDGVHGQLQEFAPVLDPDQGLLPRSEPEQGLDQARAASLQGAELLELVDPKQMHRGPLPTDAQKGDQP